MARFPAFGSGHRPLAASVALGATVLASCGAQSGPPCRQIIEAAPAQAGQPTTVVVATRPDLLPAAVAVLDKQGGNLLVARATAGEAPENLASVAVSPVKNTDIEVANAAAVQGCVETRAGEGVGGPPGDPLASLPGAALQAAQLAQGKPARVVVLGAGSSRLSGIDLEKADLSTEQLRQEAVRTIAQSYTRLRPVPGVQVLVVQPGATAANGVGSDQMNRFFEMLGQATMRWQVAPALPSVHQGPA